MKGLAKASAMQQNHRQAEGQQQQIAQAAMLDGALRAPLEEHERAEGQRRGSMAAQQVQIDGQTRRKAAGQEPGSQKTHQCLLWRSDRYSRSAPSSG